MEIQKARLMLIYSEIRMVILTVIDLRSPTDSYLVTQKAKLRETEMGMEMAI